jgi:uncharacterized membrane protein YoaK (UPF0700 family)
MISRLPGWVWIGGWVLAFVAGIINAVGFLGITHEAITHLTGSATLSAAALATGDMGTFLHFLALIGSFFVGAILSGFIVQQSALQLGGRYGAALLIESLLIFASIPLLNAGIRAGAYLAACACGLQNAMASSYSGAVVRTSHISGMITDIGIILGHWLRGLTPDRKRLALYTILLSGFVIGAFAGAVLFRLLGYMALLVPACLTGGAAIVYTLLRRRAGN